MADVMVKITQEWLNETYGDDSRWVKIPENGNTGWTTIYALRRALQIEFGFPSPTNGFGPATTAEFQKRFPNGILEQGEGDDTESNIYGIIQGACWCKGYSTGNSTITKHFYSGTGKAIEKLKYDAGFLELNSTVTLNIMKALLSMDQFKKVSGGNLSIRSIQQALNREYEDYIGLIPCDGLYGREMNKALITVLQAVEGFSPEQATGTFGNATKENLPIVPSSGKLPVEVEKQATKLVVYSLYCNGYTISVGIDEWNNTVTEVLKKFQKSMCLEETGICNTDTWMALLLSCGNTDRKYNAADTAYTIFEKNLIGEITIDRTQILKDAGIKVIGRYITGEKGKQLKFDEPKGIIDSGLKLYPIFQRDGTPTESYFTEEQAKVDADYAHKQAMYYCFPKNTIIYFAVDLDMLDTQITKYALPYFKVLKENFTKDYRIGVYGTRNLCTQVLDKGYAVTCCVSDASRGYSGNMGFKMPEKWNIDQFAVEVSLTNDFKIDKNIFADKFPVVTELTERFYYGGEVVFHGENTGRAITFGGDMVKIYFSATGADGTLYPDIPITVKFEALGPVSNPNLLYSELKLYGKLNGETYTLIYPDTGEERGFMIDAGLQYAFTYSLPEEYKDLEVKVKLEVYSYNI